MSDLEEIGEVVEKRREEKLIIEWRIPDFVSVAESKDEFNSPPYSFADNLWYLELNPRKVNKKLQSFSLCLLKRDGDLEEAVEYSLGMKRGDGRTEQLSRGIFHRNTAWVGAFLVKLPEPQKSEKLIITCKLKGETTVPQLDLSKTELTKLDTLSENFRNMFTNKEGCDTTLYVMDKEFKAHRVILMARSSVFAAMFKHETSEKQTGTVNILDCDPDSFEQFLEFVYSGKLKDLSFRNTLKLYETSEKYDVLELKEFCSEFLVNNLTEENFCDVVTLADKYNDTTLMSKAQNFFNKKQSEICATPEWDCFLTNNCDLARKLKQRSHYGTIFRRY